MRKGKRYKESKIRLVNFLWVYTIISILLIFIYTFSRYTTTVESEGIMRIAKFNVKVNNVDVVENEEFTLDFSLNPNAYKNKLLPNTNGYFEFEINPTGTEVSLEYEFKFDLTQLNENFKLLYYTINDNATHHNIIDSNTVKEDLNLINNKGFTEDQKVNVKVYWSWDEQSDIYNPDISTLDNKDIGVLAIVRQKIK